MLILALAACTTMEEQARIRRVWEMQDHETAYRDARDAIARGDLPTAQQAGVDLARPDPVPGLPADALPHLTAVRAGGTKLVQAATLPDAATTLCVAGAREELERAPRVGVRPPARRRRLPAGAPPRPHPAGADRRAAVVGAVPRQGLEGRPGPAVRAGRRGGAQPGHGDHRRAARLPRRDRADLGRPRAAPDDDGVALAPDLPHLYAWVDGLDPAKLGASRWVNLFCSGDYVGRDLFPKPVANARDVPLGAGAHPGSARRRCGSSTSSSRSRSGRASTPTRPPTCSTRGSSSGTTRRSSRPSSCCTRRSGWAARRRSRGRRPRRSTGSARTWTTW
jgi:hypothetical protein